MADLSVLQSVWLVAIVGLWCLYLVLEGFDFGVGMLLSRVRRDQYDRRVALHSIGPTWAANEVWVVIAVVGMFGAFPGWYAAWASGLYLPLVVVLLALIARNAGIELIGKRSDEAWRRRWERVIGVASFVAPFCWGLMWTAVVRGLDVQGDEVVGSPLDVVSAYSVLGGLALVSLCVALGAAFLALRTGGEVRDAALRVLRVAGPAAAVVVLALVAWTGASYVDGGWVAWAALGGCAAAIMVMAVSAVAAGGAGAGRSASREAGPDGGGGAAAGRGGVRGTAIAFGGGCVAIGLLVVSWFAVLAPEGIADAGGGAGVALAEVTAGDYSLTLMTIVAGVLLPLVLAVQAWSYWVFRARLTRADVGEPLPSPVEVVGRLAARVGSGRSAGAPAVPAASTTPAAPVDGGAVSLRGPGFRRRRAADPNDATRER